MTVSVHCTADRPDALGAAIADRVAALPRPPRLFGFGEPTHGREELLRLRNAVFAALVERAGFTRIALESCAWRGRVVDTHVRHEGVTEDEAMATGFSHGFGASPANRELVRWLREQNRHRSPAQQLRFAAVDAPMEMDSAPSPRPMVETLHAVVHAELDELDLPPWAAVDELLGDDAPWSTADAAWRAADSLGAQPRVRELRAIVDDLRRLLVAETPRLRTRLDPDDLDHAHLAARTAAGLLAYHAAMARDGERRWSDLAGLRDAMMAENLRAAADRGPVLVGAHNAHLRTGTVSMDLGDGATTMHWQPVGAHLAGPGYRAVACALGDDDPAYSPVDDDLYAEVDEVLFVRSTPTREVANGRAEPS